MDAHKQRTNLLSDIRPLPQRPHRYVSEIIDSREPSRQPKQYARFYRMSASGDVRPAPTQAVRHTSLQQRHVVHPEQDRVQGASLAHQAVREAHPRTDPARRSFTAPAHKRKKRASVKTVRRAANVLIIVALVMSSVMGFMMYRYHLALQKVEALPLQQADSQGADVSGTGTADSPSVTNLDEAVPAKTASAGSGKLAPDTPYKLSIPKLKVTGYILSVGVTKSGAMGVPGNIWQAGWYKTSAKPSENTGVVVINGHVHGPTQPGIFANLKKLTAGDVITVTDAGGTTYTYKVDSQQTYKAGEANESLLQSASPTKQGLNLVTCTGEIKGDEYLSRLVVFAERV